MSLRTQRDIHKADKDVNIRSLWQCDQAACKALHKATDAQRIR